MLYKAVTLLTRTTMAKDCLISLPPHRWVNCQGFEEALTSCRDPHREDCHHVKFLIPFGCKIMVDAAVRLLCLANQLDHVGKPVTLDFEETQTGTMGYLDRMGFFDWLHSAIEVLPNRPYVSGAFVHRGSNVGLEEIAAISPSKRDNGLPSRLADKLKEAVADHPERESLSRSAFTVFAELIDNVFQHSSTKLDGYAALQVYQRGKLAKVVVSDSGDGITNTLRPTLQEERPALTCLSDTDLVVETFRRGLSRHGPSRGCGLHESARQAIKYKAELDVRLARCRVHLIPSSNQYRRNTAYCSDRLPLIWGTHICFDFHL